jgi:DNA-binding transcriptional ArsR family regulator
MSNINFNRQFILIDFRLLEAEGFLDFIGSSEFATYLVLRRNIWRSSERHYMGLHDVYLREQLLACSLERKKVSEVTGVDPDNISRHLSKLAERKVIRRRRTGRQNIYVLGEWVDVNGDGSYKLEWFYLDGRYGVTKADLTEGVRSELSETSGLNRPGASDNNREVNREENTVKANGIEQLKRMPGLEQPEARSKYVANYILEEMGDARSARFYRLVADKIPEGAIRRMIAEIKADGARHPARVFTYKVKEYAKGS